MSDGERRAWAWAAHLREGGRTPWGSFAGAADPQGRFLPGAQQLELLRRLNAAGPTPPRLAERVLASSAPGRGRPELSLAGVDEPPAYGPAPVDPSDLPDEELIRVASGLLAEDLAAAPLPPPASGRPRPWRRPYRLVGDPWLAGPLRDALVAAGRPPGGPLPVVLVVGADAATMLTHAWALRCVGPGAPPWPVWLDEVLRPGHWPASVDLPAAAQQWADRVGPRRVRVVLDPAAAAGLVGAPRRIRRAAAPVLPADGVELARRVGPVLGVLVPPERREQLLRRVLLPRVEGPALVVPPDRRRRVRRRAQGMRADLLEGRYAVHGDPDALLRAQAPAGPVQSEPDQAAVLTLALRLLRDAGPAPRARRAEPQPEGAT